MLTHPQSVSRCGIDIQSAQSHNCTSFVLQNMVGPGEVDDELEPEVREECNGKYGAVVQVVIFEIPKAVPEEAVRIFVEFQRVESAIKGTCSTFCVQLGGR